MFSCLRPTPLGGSRVGSFRSAAAHSATPSKQQHQEDGTSMTSSPFTANANAATCPSSCSTPPRSAGISDLRIAKDIAELGVNKMSASADTRISFPKGVTNLRQFTVLVTPRVGLYAHASFLFSVFIPHQYPFGAPRVRIRTPCLHPNINWRTGQVHLHLLKNEWKPVLSLNAVIFALQLLFLESWPSGVASSGGTASSLPPSRPIIPHTNTNTNAASASSSPSIIPSSALTLASSKCATSCAARQFDEGSILNLDVYQLIIGGERGVFEDLVRRTLEGGFFFGAHWPRNRHEVDEDDEDDEDHDSEKDQHEQDAMATMLKRVEENGRKAHISPTIARRFRQRSDANGDHAMIDVTCSGMPTDTESDDMDLLARSSPINPSGLSQSPSISASPSRPHTRFLSHDFHSTYKRSTPLHRKRAFHKTLTSREHTPNPAAALASAPAGFTIRADEADRPLVKRSRNDQTDDMTELSPLRTAVCNTASRRTIQLRRFVPPTTLDPQQVSDLTRRSMRKRPNPTLSLSDGEYDESDSDVNPLHRSIMVDAKDDTHHPLDVRRRTKKQKPWSECFLTANDDDDEDADGMLDGFDDEMTSIEASIESFPYALPLARPPTMTTPLPDLTTFAAFRPPIGITPDELARRSITPRGGHTNAHTRCTDHSQSPKRNVSDCQSVSTSMIPSSCLTRSDSSSTFLLTGRSSSRSLNLYGPPVTHPLPATRSSSHGTGLSDLKNLFASLPRTCSASMVE